ncbi:acyltransferase family protein [Paludibaculum fermentans]|uniref:acyltransferase family protein n=1 Tax=Paludibaculum fermentans TaxID=1473598 RepID=UPI003EBE9595
MQATTTPLTPLKTRLFATAAARIPSLDGMRAMSILLVLFGHLVGTRGFWFTEVTDPVRALAKFGVHVFFVISGYLITRILQSEWRKRGSIRVGTFYRRRAFRILPVAIVYLSVVAMLAGLGIISMKWSDFAHAATYTMNFVDGPSWAVGHLWSLSVEEQFYIVWPVTLVLLGWRKAGAACLVFALAAPLLRVGTKVVSGHASWWAPTDADAIAVGCLLAWAGDRLGRSETYLRMLRSPIPLLSLAIPAAGIYLADRQALSYGFMQLAHLSVAVLIDRYVRYPESFGGGLLNSAILTRIGVLSYSLYIWQELFLDRTSTLAVARFPLNLVCAAGVAMVSYRFVEQPFLAWRDRFERSR